MRRPPASTASSSSTCRPRRMTSSACRRCAAGSISSASPRRPPTTSACRPCSQYRRASSIMSPSPASPARKPAPMPTCRARGRAHQARTPICPSPSASASRTPRTGRRRSPRVADGAVVGSALVDRRSSPDRTVDRRRTQAARQGARSTPVHPALCRGAAQRTGMQTCKDTSPHELAHQFRPSEDPGLVAASRARRTTSGTNARTAGR